MGTSDLRSEQPGLATLQAMTKEELIQVCLDDAKNWLAHDGLWFQAVEKDHGMAAAMEADRLAWEKFTVIEAQRIMARLGMEPGGGVAALVRCLEHRLYARLNIQETVEVTESRAVFRMNDCRVQSARNRKGLPDFPCKTVAIVEYEEFARAVDPRIRTRCVCCPPDDHPEEYHCSWEFTLDGE